MKSFTAKILIVGINPFVVVPQEILDYLFFKLGKDKGRIPVKGSINENDFLQTLVKCGKEWRLFINTPMRKLAGAEVNDIVTITIDYNDKPRIFPMPEKLQSALDKNKKANKLFNKLNASRQREIIRYISSLKTEGGVNRTINKVIQELLEKKH